ncbi:MAG: hypothetical protein AB7I50_26010, partial [Vicinamibacterales bacterium]
LPREHAWTRPGREGHEHGDGDAVPPDKNWLNACFAAFRSKPTSDRMNTPSPWLLAFSRAMVMWFSFALRAAVR